MRFKPVAALAAALWICGSRACLAARPALQAVVVRDTFADAMRDGWESYPLVEDDGYDPSLDPFTEDNLRGLTRTLAPHQTGAFTLGFARKLSLVPGSEGQISFQARILAASREAKIVVELSGGGHSRRLVVHADPGGWQAVRLALPSEDGALDAIAIYAELPHAQQDLPVQFSIAQVELRGMAVPRLAMTAPDALWDGHRALYYVRSACKPGEVFAPHFAAPAQLTLTAPDGTDRTFNAGSYRFAPHDPMGIWTLHALAGQGEATVRILLEPPQPRGLLFDAPPALSDGLLDQVRRRRDELNAKVHVDLGANIAAMNGDWLLPGLPSYFELIEPPAELALMDAVLAHYAQDRAAAQQAMAIIHSMSAWPVWVHPWFPAHGYRTYYPVGIVAADLALARQYLGPMLPDDEQDALDHALLEKAIVPAYDELVATDRMPFNVSNWIGNIAGGSLLAALTVRDPEAAGYALGLFEKDRDHIAAAYTREGDYGEGISYLCFDLEMSSMVAEAAKRRLGVNLDPWLLGADRFTRAAFYGDMHVLDFGDSHGVLDAVDAFAYLAAHSSEDQTLAFYRAYRRAEATRLVPRLLWDHDAMARGPAGAFKPRSGVFEERGAAVLRSGAAGDTRLLAMRAGPNFNHNHADQGSLSIADNGELVLGEAGYADYYKDPAYPAYVTQAIGHNVLLVDEDPESQALAGNRVIGAHPQMQTLWLGDSLQAVQADLASVYRGRLQQYRRIVLSLGDGTVLAIDLVTAAQAHVYTLLWHPAVSPRAVESFPDCFRIRTRSSGWQADSFADTKIEQQVRSSPLPLEDYARAEEQPIHRPERVEVRTVKPERAAHFVTVFSRLGKDGKPPRFDCSFLPDRIAVASADWTVEIAPRVAGPPSILLRGSNSLAMVNGTRLRAEAQSVETTMPVSLEARHQDGHWLLAVTAEKAGLLRLDGFGGRLVSNANSGRPRAASGGSLTIPIAAGAQQFEILPE